MTSVSLRKQPSFFAPPLGPGAKKDGCFRGLRTAVCGLRTADCGLRTADCGLRTADCGLRTADCGLRTADCGLRTADCGLRTADCGLRTVDCGLRTPDCRLWTAHCKLRTADYGMGIKHRGLSRTDWLSNTDSGIERGLWTKFGLNACIMENKPSRMYVLCDQFICFRPCWS